MVRSLKYKHQPFQMDAVAAVCDLFQGQPRSSLSRYIVDPGRAKKAQMIFDSDSFGFKNPPIDPSITDSLLLERVKEVQKSCHVIPSNRLEGLNFTIQMETGTGKTYVYIRTIYELNKRYG